MNEIFRFKIVYKRSGGYRSPRFKYSACMNETFKLRIELKKSIQNIHKTLDQILSKKKKGEEK